ncbi:50S ribosomal protein L32 [soil metagenome]
MAVPKRKRSRSRTRRRRAHWMRATPPPRANCARCHSAVRPHTVCPTCGHYAGRQVVELPE